MWLEVHKILLSSILVVYKSIFLPEMDINSCFRMAGIGFWGREQSGEQQQINLSMVWNLDTGKYLGKEKDGGRSPGPKKVLKGKLKPAE